MTQGVAARCLQNWGARDGLADERTNTVPPAVEADSAPDGPPWVGAARVGAARVGAARAPLWELVAEERIAALRWPWVNKPPRAQMLREKIASADCLRC